MLQSMELERVRHNLATEQNHAQYINNAYIWNLEKWYDEPICREGMEMQTENGFVDTVG